MKKILTILGLFFIFFTCTAQIQNKLHSLSLKNDGNYYVPDYNLIEQINITNNQMPNKNGWALHGTTCAGCASYFYKIKRTTRSIQAEDGNYYYYYFFYFFSNSHYTSGEIASTYLKNLNFYVDGEWVLEIDWLLINSGVPIAGAWCRTKHLHKLIQFKVTQISVH